MTDKAISPLRRRLIEDMAIRRLGPKTQQHYRKQGRRPDRFMQVYMVISERTKAACKIAASTIATPFLLILFLPAIGVA
jgi:uncharacterized protein YceH (UPF0502 family)